MDFEAFDEEWVNLSPLSNLWPSSPPAATATQRTNALQSDDGLDDDSGDDDGLYGDASPGGLRDDCSESSFGNEELVVVAAEQYSWKMDYAKGDYKFRGVLACCTSANSG
jgi:hypothetical protein